MAYDNKDEEKTYRIGFLCGTLILIALLVFLFKTEACEGCESASEANAGCKEKYYEIDEDHHVRTCPRGSKVEVVTSPPAPKPAIICHCDK
jgi:hypothetical protein